MLKLVYDLKAGFEDCYLTIKDEEWDLTDILEVFVESEEYEEWGDLHEELEDLLDDVIDQLESRK